jgi:hypothetical protein|tara:strand:- start:3368 stop:3595 length:228 start_codon:yes stop_codon:yes gene_type:complete
MRYLILPVVMVSVALNVAGCALKFDMQGNYKGVVDPRSHGQHVNEYTPSEYKHQKNMELLSAHGFTNSSFINQGK